RNRVSPPYPRHFYLQNRLICRALEHGIALNHLRRALGSTFSSTQIFYSNFRRLRRRFHDRLRASDLVEPHSWVAKLAFLVFRKTRGWRTWGAIRFAGVARRFSL